MVKVGMRSIGPHQYTKVETVLQVVLYERISVYGGTPKLLPPSIAIAVPVTIAAASLTR